MVFDFRFTRGTVTMVEDMAIYNKLKVLMAEKEIREGRKLSYKTLASEAGIPVSVLTVYAGQKVKRIDIQTLEKLCRYFGVQPGDLLIFADNPPAPNSKKKK